MTGQGTLLLLSVVLAVFVCPIPTGKGASREPKEDVNRALQWVTDAYTSRWL